MVRGGEPHMNEQDTVTAVATPGPGWYLPMWQRIGSGKGGYGKGNPRGADSPGPQWCDIHGLCAHTTEECRDRPWGRRDRVREGTVPAMGPPKPKPCIWCDSQEHLSHTCPKYLEQRQKSWTCWSCGQKGHKVSQCPVPNVEDAKLM